MIAQRLTNLKKSRVRFVASLLSLGILLSSCGDDTFLDEALRVDEAFRYFNSGDVIIVSGGAVATTTAPYPLHMITQWSKDGEYIRTLAETTAAATYLYATDINPEATSIFYSVENADRIERIDMSTLITTTHIIDPQLTGTTVRGVASLSDGGTVVAESTTIVEKFDANQVRVTTNFPITVTATIQHLKRISGDRFVLLFNGGVDNPRVYSNEGVLLHSIAGPACAANCDPNDIVELPDGRFVVSYNIASLNSLEIFDSSFNHLGQLLRNTTILPTPGALAVLENGDVLACTTVLNTCERIAIDGITGSRVGTSAFIGDASRIRQPTSVQVVP